MKKPIISIGDLKADDKNARRHGPRNVDMIVQSLREVGAARSGVIDENGKVLAGNATLEALTQAGISKIRVVDSNADEWVVVRRSGMTEEQKTRLALYDNRASELSEWDKGVLGDLNQENLLDGLFTDKEIEAIIGPEAPESFQKVDENISTDHTCPKCGYAWSSGSAA